MACVSLRNISKVYAGGSAHAVRDFNLEIEDGELVVFVGPSGCGKSTTLRMIAGLEEPSGGEVWIGSRQVTDLEPKDRNVAMVFQNYALYPQKTVYGNLSFGLSMRGLAAAEIDRRVRHAAGLLGLEGLLERKPKQLSGGQMQRVALGRALVREPDVFLLDEPLSNLDAKLRVRMREEIARIHAELKTSMVYVTHDQIEAMTLGDRIVVMKDGLVQQVGTPLELYDRPANAFVAGFIGSPEMNFVEGELDGTGAVRRFRAGDLELPLALALEAGGPAVQLGIRPEHIERAAAEAADGALRVIRVEQFGAQTCVRGTLKGVHLSALFERDDRIAAADEIPIRLQPARVHLFDRASERRLNSRDS
jgi:multiple sugar transport system ATP-binding protein